MKYLANTYFNSAILHLNNYYVKFDQLSDKFNLES